jgi:hypothetical protein
MVQRLALWLALVDGALHLRPAAFTAVPVAAAGLGPGLLTALLAGFSQALGQAFILFVNRVRPLRFGLSLLVEALLFWFGFLVWGLSTWVALRLLGVVLPPVQLLEALGLAHAPQLFAMFGGLPYLGSPLLSLLSLWTAMAFVAGVVAVTGLAPWAAFASLALGWLLMHALQRTAGQPLVALGRRWLERVAGVPLVHDRRRLAQLLREGEAPRGLR